jgi:flavoprotein
VRHLTSRAIVILVLAGGWTLLHPRTVRAEAEAGCKQCVWNCPNDPGTFCLSYGCKKEGGVCVSEGCSGGFEHEVRCEVNDE